MNGIAAIKKKKEVLRERIRNNRNFAMQRFLVILITGYALFLTSGVWFPDIRNLKDATPYYQKVQYEDYAFYLTQFVYSEKDDAIQVIIEIENNDVKEEKLVYSAKERTSGSLDVKCVQEDPNYAVLRISGVGRWKEISLRVQETGKDTQVKFYANINAVERVASLPELTSTQYLVERLQGQIAFDNEQIRQKEEQIKALQGENQKIDERIAALEGDTYPTETEAQNAKELIVRAQSQKNSNEATIRDREEEIMQLQERTDNIKGQIHELEE